MMADERSIIEESDFDPLKFCVDGNEEAEKILAVSPNEVSIYISQRFVPKLERKNVPEIINSIFLSCFDAFRGKLPPHIIFDEITEYYSMQPERCWGMLCHTVKEEIYNALPDIIGMRRPEEKTVRQKSFRGI